jgi:hypothetical protein
MLSPSDIAGIRERLERITDGPWTPESKNNDIGHWDFIFGTMWNGAEKKRVIFGDFGREDAEFICHARTDIPNLLSHIEALEERLRKAVDVIEQEAVKYVPYMNDADENNHRRLCEALAELSPSVQ